MQRREQECEGGSENERVVAGKNAIKEHFVRSIKQTRHTYISPHEHFNISPHNHPFGGRSANALEKERECYNYCIRMIQKNKQEVVSEFTPIIDPVQNTQY